MKHTFQCVDAHTCGNPVRLIVKGAPELKGTTMFEKRKHFLEEFDWIRKGLMFEPRGHDMMSGSMLYPPADPGNDVGILFIETSGCLPMCGHGTIGTITMALEEGLIRPKTPGIIRAEVPAGIIEIQYREEHGKILSVRITNVPSFLYGEGYTVNHSVLGEIRSDVAYGGNFYAIVDPQKNFRGLGFHTAEELIVFARELRRLMNDKYEFIHPENPEIRGLSHVLWTGTPLNPGSTARNAVFYGDKAIDRSPCGTGTSARMAQWHAQGKLNPGDTFTHESYIGSIFTGTIEKITRVGNFNSIVPSIEGWARVTGHNTIYIDTSDPYAFGFQVI